MLGTSLLCMPAAMLHAGLILGMFFTVEKSDTSLYINTFLTQCKRFNIHQSITVFKQYQFFCFVREESHRNSFRCNHATAYQGSAINTTIWL